MFGIAWFSTLWSWHKCTHYKHNNQHANAPIQNTNSFASNIEVKPVNTKFLRIYDRDIILHAILFVHYYYYYYAANPEYFVEQRLVAAWGVEKHVDGQVHDPLQQTEHDWNQQLQSQSRNWSNKKQLFCNH